ncbi:hypothetical protein N7G274_010215 [Stereocaulon virgatum]|uniref:Uncharacterized protein n=1 Tax=Stereocaulon virgatum TaxID=373712 RepID=A0ABR4A187_9LECA
MSAPCTTTSQISLPTYSNTTPNSTSPNASADSTNLNANPTSPNLSDTSTQTPTPDLIQAPTMVQTSASRAALIPIPAQASVGRRIVRGLGNWWIDPLAVYAAWFGIVHPGSQRVRPAGIEAVPRHV